MDHFPKRKNNNTNAESKGEKNNNTNAESKGEKKISIRIFLN